MDKGKGLVYIVGEDRLVTKMWFEAGYSILKGDIKKADIVCFIGGADIDPQLYNEEKSPFARVYTNPDDDRRDLIAWSDAGKHTLKIGICRGAQFLHAMNGGTLFQDVRGHSQGHKVHDTVFKKELIVTSSHHQMMRPNDKAEVFAYAEGIGSSFVSEKGLVEAPEYEPEVLWYEDTKSLCIQSHPEWEMDRSGGKYFFDLVEMVR